jgi:hypothetical protein
MLVLGSLGLLIWNSGPSAMFNLLLTIALRRISQA